MNGITNAQQQGGGGGSAASYKAIKSSIAVSDWQEVASGVQPYFVGENAMEWAKDDNVDGARAKHSEITLGITGGVDYTISATVDGKDYTKTAQMVDPSETGGMKVLMFLFEADSEFGVAIYDDISAMMPGSNSMALIQAPDTVTNFVITNFDGEGFGTVTQATIFDSAIKVNSAVTMYVNTSEKFTLGEKTNGNVTLIAPSVPETSISYSLEIVGTDSEGLFELVNGYVPEIPDTPSGAPQWHTIYEDPNGTGVTSIEFANITFKQGGVYRIALDGESHIFCLPYDAGDLEHKISIVTALPVVAYYSVSYHIMTLLYSDRSLSTSYEVRYDVTETGISNYDFSTAPELKFTKIEAYY